jgi:hypothetical protein
MVLLLNLVPGLILGAASGPPSLVGAPNRLIQTAHGPLEYAVLGEGLPLVVMHGSGGGTRQA